MNKPLAASSLVADLARQAEFAGATSVLYRDLFGILRELFERAAGGEDAVLQTTLASIESEWAQREWTTWFERPLMLAAAFHRLAAGGDFPRLASLYATCGGAYDPAQRETLRAELIDVLTTGSEQFMAVLRSQRVQTNEISRGICWQLALAALFPDSAAPIVLVELGCSAGLNLISDRYLWQLGGRPAVAKPEAPVPQLDIALVNASTAPLAPILDARESLGARIVWRVGCDLHIPDLGNADDRAMLASLIWGDNPERLRRFHLAAETQAPLLASGLLELRRADALAFVPQIAQELPGRVGPGALICFFNTVVTCYFDAASYARLQEQVFAAFRGPLAAYTCVWVEHEPRSESQPGALAHRGFDSLVRVRRIDTEGQASTVVVAGTETHPRSVTLLELDRN
jgi:hypothetical protein